MSDLTELLEPIVPELMKRRNGYLQNNDLVMADNYERYALRVSEAMAALEQKDARIAELERENQTLKGCLTILDHDARQALESR